MNVSIEGREWLTPAVVLFWLVFLFVDFVVFQIVVPPISWELQGLLALLLALLVAAYYVKRWRPRRAA